MTARRGQWSSLTRRWLLGVIPVLLALTAWWCYTDGTVTRGERVTVTRASMGLEYLPPAEGSGRIGSTPGVWQTRYHVECVSLRGEACRIDVSRLIDYLAYREGDQIGADATFHKPHGVWALTDWGRFFAWLSLAALAIGGLLIRREARRVALADAAPRQTELPRTSLAAGQCALTSRRSPNGRSPTQE